VLDLENATKDGMLEVPEADLIHVATDVEDNKKT
jgi:hypothetical protein